MRLLFVLLCFLLSHSGHTLDLKFRWKDGYCQKSKAPGTNPEFFGECGNQTGSHQINKKYKDAHLVGGVFNSTYFYVTTFDGGDLSHLALRRSVLLQTFFKLVKGTHMDLRGSHLKGVQFAKSDLRNMLATGTRFVKVSFQDCDLRDSNFWGSQLQEVNLQGADLRGANLRDTFLLLTNLESAKFDDKTQLPFSEEIAVQKGMVKSDSVSESTN